MLSLGLGRIPERYGGASGDLASDYFSHSTLPPSGEIRCGARATVGYFKEPAAEPLGIEIELLADPPKASRKACRGLML
jgi:hypothetical protein